MANVWTWFPRSRWTVALLALLAGALIAAACSDKDFDGAPDDRGAAAAVAAGIVEEAETAQVEADQAAVPGAEPVEEPEAVETDDAGPPVEPEAVSAELLGDPEHGQELFFANGCTICHGDNGEGGIGPTVASTGLSLDQVIEQYRSPRGTMPAFQDDRISDDDIADIFSWLLTLELPENIVPGQGTP
jgi:mono/diheme cytochrome c family protein